MPPDGGVGFGGGYYDGVIDEARAGGAAVIGFAYDFQIVDRCPAGPDDRAVDVVVTDARVIRARGRSASERFEERDQVLLLGGG